ncbi:methyl-accepting chemotaxis protein [Inediibacterium massiliense]|uniref:methyl-accepting chemotaxis protein n=1 Tax=Inediibacterium massiliense TaxID=1658111 RepID=UPI0006B43E95|nr:methyl-accepting chemotaxis protein [Inediibacterium massiliense]
MKLQEKLILIMVGAFLLLGVSTTTMAKYFITQLATEEIERKLDGDLHMGYELLEQKYPGDWKIENEKIYKGQICLGDGKEENGNYELVDTILKQTGSAATIFMKAENISLEETNGYREAPYVRVSTNVQNANGARAVGTKISKEVADKVEEGQDFIGQANVAGKLYHTKYTPIYNKQGKVIGIWFVGVPTDHIQETVKAVIFKFVVVIMIIMMITIAISVLFIKKITGRIKKIVQTIEEMKNQNLTVTCNVNSKDETGDISKNLNYLIDTLNDLLGKISNSSEIVASTSNFLSQTTEQTTIAIHEVAKGVENIAQGASTQAKEMEEGVKKANDLADKIENVITLAGQMYNISFQTDQKSNQGLNMVELLTQKSQKTTQATTNVHQNILEVDEQAQKIGMIIETIGQIAQQTNLLALNASIEAARAGESGKGFVVVAEEIRKLAEGSRDAVDQIQNLIQGVQNQSNVSVQLMNETQNIVKENEYTVKEAKKLFVDIIEAVSELSEKISQVEEYTKDMEKSKNEIVSMTQSLSSISIETSAATEEVSASTQEQLAAIEEVASASQDLSKMAEELKQSIQQFLLQ